MIRPIALALPLALALASPALAQERPLAIDPTGQNLTWGKCPPIFATGCEIAVLHGDPAKPDADVFLRIASGATLASHWHSSAERMTLSAGELRVAYEGADPVTLRPGSYAYGPAKHVHEAQCVSQAACILFIAFEGPVDAHPAPGKTR